MISAANTNETGNTAGQGAGVLNPMSTLDNIELGQLAPSITTIHRGKVRDSFRNPKGHRIIVTTDRLSCFDRQICSIPFKGRVLNQLSRFWFEKTSDICPNHLLSMPHPNVSIVRDCAVFPIEFIVRGYLTGSSSTSILTRYEAGDRSYCGHNLANDLSPHQVLSQPIVTPTTKADGTDHDELTSRDALISSGVIEANLYDQIEALSLALFLRGQDVARKQGLILVDTKYEFGKDKDGVLRVVDEVHTPDSSRYWYADRYQQDFEEGRVPRALDKDFLRRYLQSVGYFGEGSVPEVPGHIRVEASKRYLEIYEVMTGEALALGDSPAQSSAQIAAEVKDAIIASA